MTETQLQEYEAIVASVERGDDPYVVPEELVEEPEPPKPINKSMYAVILAMAIGEKLKLALKGNRDARMILIRDSNQLIQRFVLLNPRITDDEILMIARNRNVEGEVLRKIGDHKYWPRNYQVKLSLVSNPKTPVSTAIHFVNTLAERDLRFLAKSKNVSAAVTSHAKRLLFYKGKKE